MLESNRILDLNNPMDEFSFYEVMNHWRMDNLAASSAQFYDYKETGWGFMVPQKKLYDAFVAEEGVDGYRLNHTMKTYEQIIFSDTALPYRQHHPCATTRKKNSFHNNRWYTGRHNPQSKHPQSRQDRAGGHLFGIIRGRRERRHHTDSHHILKLLCNTYHRNLGKQAQRMGQQHCQPQLQLSHHLQAI
jgi:hypothetical protein